MICHQRPFIHFVFNASKVDRAKERSRISKYVSHTMCSKSARVRFVTLRSSLHRATRQIAAAGQVQKRLGMPCGTASSLPDLLPGTVPSPAPLHAEEKALRYTILPGINTGEDQLDLLDHNEAFISSMPHQICNPEMLRSKDATLEETKYRLWLMTLSASSMAKESHTSSPSYLVTLDMRIQCMEMLRFLIAAGPTEAVQPALLLPVCCLFKSECTEGNVTAAKCHAKALDVLFHAGLCTDTVLVQALRDDIRLALRRGHRTLLAPQPDWVCLSTDSSTLGAIHSSLIHPPLIETWVSLKDIMCGPKSRRVLDEQVCKLALQKQLIDMRLDLLEALVMADQAFQDRLVQATLCTVLLLLTTDLLSDGAANLIPNLMSNLRETHEALFNSAVGSPESACIKVSDHEAGLFALFVGAVYEQRIHVCFQAPSDWWFTRQLAEVSKKMHIFSASDMQKLVSTFWPVELLSCDIYGMKWSGSQLGLRGST